MEISKRQLFAMILMAIVAIFVLSMYTNSTVHTLYQAGHAYAGATLRSRGKESKVNHSINKFLSRLSLSYWSNDTVQTRMKKVNISQGHLNVSTATMVTFDPDLVVHMKVSPYTNFTAPKHRPGQNHTFRLVMLRRPAWMERPDFSSCEYNCAFDGDGVDQINNKTDVVHVYAVGLTSQFKPPRRWPHQLYAVSSWESPVHTHADFLTSTNSVWNKFFNMTISYRLDSDLVLPYSILNFQPVPLEQRPNYYEIAKRKRKTAAWFVSNCHTPSRREEYVKEMQEYIDVTIYGACGNPCPRDGNPCLKDLRLNYKFYLSFENSLCTDYISEKMFKIYDQGLHVIPVARGAGNYDQHFPNFTFINAAHFKTAKDLALYLKDLASDLETYSKYLEYIDMYQFNGHWAKDLSCKFCEFLHTREKTTKIYDMKTWMGDGHCLEPSDIR